MSGNVYYTVEANQKKTFVSVHRRVVGVLLCRTNYIVKILDEIMVNRNTATNLICDAGSGETSHTIPRTVTL